MDPKLFKSNITLVKDIQTFIMQHVTKSFDLACRFSNHFYSLYNDEKKTLPFHINILDLIWANENDHSKIFSKLLCQKQEGKYEILESFFKYLSRTNESFKVRIKSPKITSEKERIDVLILDKEFALIIENKIHNAIDQDSQIARYIEKVKEKGYKNEDIFILYLTRDSNKSLSSQSWRYKDKNYNQIFNNRYLQITFRDDILVWLKREVLPNCRLKDIYLRSTIEQYVDHLEGLFNKREIHKNMNDKLKRHIEAELNLGDSIERNIEILKEKETEFNKISENLKVLRNENEIQCFKNWFIRLKNDFPNYKLIDYSDASTYRKIGVKLEYCGYPFSILIEKEYGIYYGIGRHNSSETILNELFPILNLDRFGMKRNQWWYGWKYTSFENGYQRLFDLIKLIEKEIDEKNKA